MTTSTAGSFDASAFLVGSGLAAAAVAAVLTIAWVVAGRVGRYNLVDVAWGLGFVVVAAVTWTVAQLSTAQLSTQLSTAQLPGAADPGRRTLVLVLTAGWGLRLAGDLLARSRREPVEDPRYAALLDRAEAAGRSRWRAAVTRIYLTQGVTMWFVSLPVQVAMFQPARLHALGAVGVAGWALGMVFETVGDRQLAAFRKDPSSRGRVLDTGLWRYTRHPNYFGDACVWWGLFLVAAASWPGVLTVLSPALMTYLLCRGTGARLLEGTIGDRRPGYADYISRTSGFIPRRPRRTD